MKHMYKNKKKRLSRRVTYCTNAFMFNWWVWPL